MLLVTCAVVVWFSRLGSWGPAFERLVAARGPQARVAGAVAGALFVLLLIGTNTLTVLGLVGDHLPYAEMSRGTRTVVTVLVYTVVTAPVLVFFARLARKPGPGHQARQAPRPQYPQRGLLPRTSLGPRCGTPGWRRWPIGSGPRWWPGG